MMPQGSVLGPFDFPPYMIIVFNIAQKHGVSIHMYADDTQLYFSFSPSDSAAAISKMEKCIAEIREWMDCNYLKLNDSKTEFMVIGPRHLVAQVPSPITIVIGDATVPAVPSARNIGAVIDDRLSMAGQVSSICRSCYIQLRDINQIRPYITQECAATLVHSLVTSKLDSLNSLLYGVPDYLIKRLQLVQNNAARIVTLTKKHDTVRPLLLQLHWLPVHFRITYKILLLAYKALHGQAPIYISEMLKPYVPSRVLRSSAHSLLVEPQMRLKTVGDRAYSACAPKLWNCLPENIRSTDTVESFKRLLKTYLFSQAIKSGFFDA